MINFLTRRTTKPEPQSLQHNSLEELHNLVEQTLSTEADAKDLRAKSVELANWIEQDMLRTREQVDTAMRKLAPSSALITHSETAAITKETTAEFESLLATQPG